MKFQKSLQILQFYTRQRKKLLHILVKDQIKETKRA